VRSRGFYGVSDRPGNVVEFEIEKNLLSARFQRIQYRGSFGTEQLKPYLIPFNKVRQLLKFALHFNGIRHIQRYDQLRFAHSDSFLRSKGGNLPEKKRPVRVRLSIDLECGGSTPLS
jgi:hypothetical protein